MFTVNNEVSGSTNMLDAINLRRSGIFIFNFEYSQKTF